MAIGAAPSVTGPDPVQSRIVAALRRPGVLRHDGRCAELIETHISYVLLTGGIAYKLKKAVRLGFLDFSTLEARRFYCEEELRLNRRLAPLIYLAVVAITGDPDRPAVDGGGPVLDYAVKMREFPQGALLSGACDRDELGGPEIDELAARIGRFHATAPVAPAGASYGAPDEVLGNALANFDVLQTAAGSTAERGELDSLREWTLREHDLLRDRLVARLAEGWVRECHGDLHLGNIALVDGEIMPFDCIEFNDRMRWIDVAADIAFTSMDLHDRGRSSLAHRFLDTYMQQTGDYGAVALLPFLQVYRAMVRAKVAALRAMQFAPGVGRALARSDYRDCIDLATRLAAPRPRAMVVTHGLAGCGKSVLTQALVECTGATRIRTDVERKRLAGLSARDRSGSGISTHLYAEDNTRRTYQRVLQLASDIVAAGTAAVADGTFLARWQRDLFRNRAVAAQVPFLIIAIDAPDAVLRTRIVRRAEAELDASEAGVDVLEHQLSTRDPIGEDEKQFVVRLDGHCPLAVLRTGASWRALVEQLAPMPPSFGTGERTEVDSSGRVVAYLSRPRSFVNATKRVERIETHLSWIFLTDRHAFKLKKPMCTAFVDLRTLAARRRSAAEEVRLNRRLAPDVYLGAVPLLIDAAGGLAFDRGEDVADWLVQMRRLPREGMLDRKIAQDRVGKREVDLLVQRLWTFYSDAARCNPTEDGYRDGFAAGIAENLHELTQPEFGLDVERVRDVCSRQSEVLTNHAMFDARVRSQRIVEVHGDLRPEHICLDPALQFIDCLDFSRALRMQDTVDEIAFLALELERLGSALGSALLEAYRHCSGDSPPDPLVHFYQSYRAMIRAKIAAWHLRDPGLGHVDKWRAQAGHYLQLAGEHTHRCVR